MENEKIHPSISSRLNIILCIVIGFVILKIPWFLDLLIKYPRFDFETSGFLLIPLILLPISVPIASQLLKKKRQFATFYLILIIISFIIMIIIEMGLIFYIQRFIPTNPTDIPTGLPPPSMWLSNEQMPMILITLWFFASLLFLTPTTIAIIFITTPNKNQWIQSGHFSIIMIAIMFGIREWLYFDNGIYYLFVGIILLPFIFHEIIINFSNLKEFFSKPKEKDIIPQPTTGILFFIGFWVIVLEAQASGHMDGSFLWIIPAIGNFLVLLIVRNEKFNRIFIEKQQNILKIAWLIMGGASICYISGFLSAGFNQYYQIFLGIGSILLILFPEFLIGGTPKIKSILRIPHQLFVGFSFLIGLLLAFIANIEDPISSYITIIIFIGCICIGLLELRQEKIVLTTPEV